MANLNAPSGLSPVQYRSANSWNGALRLYYIPSTDTNAYAIGDPVKSLTGAASANGIPSVTLATAGTSNAIRGVIMTAGMALGSNSAINVAGTGFYDPNALGSIVIPASKTQSYFVGVLDDPDCMFEVQEWGGASYTAFTSADVGKNCNLKAGTNNGYVSGWVLDTTAASAVTVGLQVKLISLIQRRDNAFGQYARWLVQINQHELNSPTVGV